MNFSDIFNSVTLYKLTQQQFGRKALQKMPTLTNTPELYKMNFLGKLFQLKFSYIVLSIICLNSF